MARQYAVQDGYWSVYARRHTLRVILFVCFCKSEEQKLCAEMETQTQICLHHNGGYRSVLDYFLWP